MSANRPATRDANAWSTGAAPYSLAYATASAIFDRTRAVPAAAASTSHAAAPAPIAENAASAGFFGTGCPLPGHSRAAGVVGRVMLVAELRAAPLAAEVTGDLPRAVPVDDGDDQFLPGPARPYPLVHVLVRHRVTHPGDADGRIPPTRRVCPNATVTGCSGSALAAPVLRASSSDRCPAGDPVRRVFTWAQNAAHAACSSPNVAYLLEQVRLRGHQVGLGDPHQDSVPPLVCGSAGTHVRMVIP